MRHEYRIVPLKRNGVGYLVGNYVYIKDGTKHDGHPHSIFLRCQKYKSCRARGTLSLTGSCALDCEDGHHNHPAPDVLAMLFRQAAIQTASDPENSEMTAKGVYAKTCAAYSKDYYLSKERLPPFSSVKWAIKTHRPKPDNSSSNRKCSATNNEGTVTTHWMPPDALFQNLLMEPREQKTVLTNMVSTLVSP